MLDLEQLAVLRLERQGDELRSEGRLDEARETFERLLATAPHHLKADRLVAILGGRAAAVASKTGGLKPAPFVRARDFLPLPLHDRILDVLLAHANQFEPAAVEKYDGSQAMPGVHVDHRQSVYLAHSFNCLDQDTRDSIERQLCAAFPAVLDHLGVPSFEVHELEEHALIYRDGDFFNAHRDICSENTRRVTFIYYLHRIPKRFTGGDLLLYDTYFYPDGPFPGAPLFSRTAYTRISCVANEALFFPSEFFHEVLPVLGVGGDLQRARIAISGWFHTTREAGELQRIAATPY